MKLINFLMVGLGGAVGSMLRYGVTLLFAAEGWDSKAGRISSWLGSLGLAAYSGQLATMAVNVLGSFAIGYLSGSVRGETLLLLLTVGMCGGFTTFSTYSMQSVRLIQNGRLGAAALYITLTVLLCLLFTALGYHLAMNVKS